jgi:hypothetical protein
MNASQEIVDLDQVIEGAVVTPTLLDLLKSLGMADRGTLGAKVALSVGTIMKMPDMIRNMLFPGFKAPATSPAK